MSSTYLLTWNSLQAHGTPQWFRDAKFGICTHWGIYSVPARGPNGTWYPYNMYRAGTEQHRHHVATYGDPSVFGYKDFIPMFTAEKFDPDELAELYRRSGARFAGPHRPREHSPRYRHFWRLEVQAALREGDWKIYRRRPDQPWQLYHLPEDVAGERDLSAEEPARLAALATAWEKLNAKWSRPARFPRQEQGKVAPTHDEKPRQPSSRVGATPRPQSIISTQKKDYHAYTKARHMRRTRPVAHPSDLRLGRPGSGRRAHSRGRDRIGIR